MIKWRSFAGYFVLCTGLFALDRITKFLMLQRGYSPVRVTSFFSLQLSFNRGISWGLFNSQNTASFIMVTLMTCVVTCLLAAHVVKQWRVNSSVWGGMLAFTGAFSNIIDRVMYGAVVDFILFSFGDWSWPIFNIADACIVIGIFSLVFILYKEG